MPTSLPLDALAVRDALREARPLGCVNFGDRVADVLLAHDSLWAVVEGRAGGGIALRALWSPGGALEMLAQEGDEAQIQGSMGRFRVRIAEDRGLLRVTATLTPEADVEVPWWPRDLYPLGPDGDPARSRGRILAAQRGLNSGLIYGALDEPAEGTFLYWQDLTALNEFHRVSGTKPDGVVGGAWPELGHRARPTANPLRAGEEVVLTDALLWLSDDRCEDPREEARVFLDGLAAIYPALRKPETTLRDWPALAEKTLAALRESPSVTKDDGGYRYLFPYLQAEEPDSMAQITVLNAVRDYTDWRGEADPITQDLRAGLFRFFDPELGTLRRYLPTVDGRTKNPDEVDSWYLYHPLQGLGRLARDGDAGARDLFLASLDYAIEVARRFDYEWPIRFDVKTLKVIEGERSPGEPGQTDAGGLYAAVMHHAHDLTGDDRFLEEAKAALRATADRRFELAYQTNLTSWGFGACLRTWRKTGDRFFLDQSLVFLASFLHNCAIWESDLLLAEHYDVFLGVTCLHDGPYLAPYECYESFCAFGDALETAGDDLPETARLLVTEYMRYGLDRGWWFYPEHLPETALSREVRNGVLDRRLAIPLEDLYVGGDPAGQVGQEVYGAGMALAFASRAFRRLPDGWVCSEYPFREFSPERFVVHGAPGTACRVWISRGDRVEESSARAGEPVALGSDR